MSRQRLRAGDTARLGAVLAACILILSACAPIDNIQQGGVDISDPCYSPRQVLLSAKEGFSQTISQGATTGAVVGGLLGLFTDGDIQAGAEVGEQAGAAAGYYKAKRDEVKTRQDLIAAIQGDFATDNQQLNKVGKAVRKITQCRRNQYRGILADFKAGKLDHNTALARKKAVDLKIEQERKLVEQLLEGSGKRAGGYTAALDAGFALPPGELIKTLQSEHAKYIALRSANVRSRPSTSGAIVGGLVKGRRVYVAAGNKIKAWQAILRPNGEIGYVHGSLIAPEGSRKASRVLSKSGGKPGMPEVAEIKAHDAAYDKVSQGIDELVAMQQFEAAKLSFLEESTI
uniref:SH3 domain-containing protein n=1 Tax=Candidatus Kentrum sp. MB TaxID=2138164 RepID=A0A450XD64_9GAMM|nr:MAG: SH3 domain-containing protein [Candidatus Kentron sp. MB]VFK31070.1 MAG: SH3 domain-containing protein [Candidatus Kentron sp. MB]VFK75506.1 MAG: SH3 domain-containing protein [Candidatus Kentron sp. MB]